MIETSEKGVQPLGMGLGILRRRSLVTDPLWGYAPSSQYAQIHFRAAICDFFRGLLSFILLTALISRIGY